MSDRNYKFDKEFKLLFNKHPAYDLVKFLFNKYEIMTGREARNTLNKIRLYKETNKIFNQDLDKYYELVNRVKEYNPRVMKGKNELIIDEEKIGNGYTFITHKIELKKMIINYPSSLITQKVKYYNISGFEKESETFNFFSKGKRSFKEFVEYVEFNMTIDSPRTWIIENFINSSPGNYCVIVTEAYTKKKRDENVNFRQLYKRSSDGICVYNAFLEYFGSKLENRNAKAVYNKLLNNDELKKAYTDDNINEIVKYCNSSLTIRDVINGNNKKFINECARFNIELINSKFNHLDLLTNSFIKNEEVEKGTFNELKNMLPFYIEKMGLLITQNTSYVRLRTEFNNIFDEWKNNIGYNKYFIKENAEVMDILENYDYSMHRFFTFNGKFPIDNNLYREIDLIKAYYNYSDINYNKYYVGVPSGAFICCNGESFGMKDFLELQKKKLIGYFEIKINKIYDDRIIKLGFKTNFKYTLTSPMISILSSYCLFDFINVAYCPSVHIPFNSKFLNKDENGVKHYCKVFGLMLKTSDYIDITIKPLDGDKEYYKTIDNEQYDIFQCDDLVKISCKDKMYKSYRHIAYFIHSYTKCLIFDQLMKMNLDDVIGVKLDSICYKKDAKFEYNSLIFDTDKKPKIEELLKNTSLLDIEDDDISSNYYDDLFKSYNSDYNFKKSFLQTEEFVLDRIVYIGGKGGSGKTTSLLSNLDENEICYTSSCWNLICGMKKKYNNIKGYSIPNLTGYCDNYKVEKIVDNYIKYIVIDEITLLNKKDILNIIKSYSHCYIFILGDVDLDGFFYQCKLDNNQLFLPENCQYVKYTKNYRFNDELNNKLDELRSFMRDGKDCLLLEEWVKQNFSMCYKKIEDVEYRDEDIGISGINDYSNNYNLLTKYFVNKGSKEKYFVKKTNKVKGEYKGDESLPGSNTEMKLFKTIHSFQGLDLNEHNKIIINISSVFDYNLFYTALSRARRLDQIVILDDPYINYCKGIKNNHFSIMKKYDDLICSLNL